MIEPQLVTKRRASRSDLTRLDANICHHSDPDHRTGELEQQPIK
jgi:hypothetical protein